MDTQQAAPALQQPPPQSQNNTAASAAVSSSYKRASRKGAPRRFACDYPGCDKIYSRAEHLQRHQLNRAITRAPLMSASPAGLTVPQMPPRRSTVAILLG